MQCSIDHIVLNVEDTEAMIAFYSDILGLEPERLKEYRAGIEPFPSVRLNPDTIIDLFPKKMWLANEAVQGGRTHFNHVCFSLSKETWQDLFKRLRTNNITIVEGPVPRWGLVVTEYPFIFRIRKVIILKHVIMDSSMQLSVCPFD